MPTKDNLPEVPYGVSLAEIIEEYYEVVDLAAAEDFSILRALSGETESEILAAPESVSLDEITGEHFWLDGIDFFAKTQLQSSDTPYYVYLKCRWDDGRGFSGTTGSAYSMSRAIGMDRKGLLPAKVMTVKVPSKSKPGQESLWIVSAPKRHETNGGPVIETTAEAQLS